MKSNDPAPPTAIVDQLAADITAVLAEVLTRNGYPRLYKTIRARCNQRGETVDILYQLHDAVMTRTFPPLPALARAVCWVRSMTARRCVSPEDRAVRAAAGRLGRAIAAAEAMLVPPTEVLRDVLDDYGARAPMRRSILWAPPPPGHSYDESTD